MIARSIRFLPRPAQKQARCAAALAGAILTLLAVSPAAAQQTHVTRFDAFTGYTYLDSPSVGLGEHGFHFQIGVRPRTWFSLGFDYSIATGDLALTPDKLVAETAARLSAQLAQLAAAGRLPPGYVLRVPVHSRTQTFAAGPQFAYRRFKKVTLFLRPSCGIIKELATPRPGDAIATAIVNQLAPSGEKSDNVIFLGFGGGADFNFTNNFGLRIQADLVRDHLFNDLLKDARGTVRFSIGPCFNFGKNIVK